LSLYFLIPTEPVKGKGVDNLLCCGKEYVTWERL